MTSYFTAAAQLYRPLAVTKMAWHWFTSLTFQKQIRSSSAPQACIFLSRQIL